MRSSTCARAGVWAGARTHWRWVHLWSGGNSPTTSRPQRGACRDQRRRCEIMGRGGYSRG
eukprot:5691003-Prymnesium_polylepis.1